MPMPMLAMCRIEGHVAADADADADPGHVPY